MATLEALLKDLDRVIRPADSCDAAVCGTCGVLRRYAESSVDLPERLTRQSPERYARHLVYQADQDGYVVVAMVWGPGQGTPVHDHGGTWCVEGCVRGQLEITSFRMLGDVEEGRVRMERESSVQVGVGKVGCLIPPFEHHRIHNPFDDTAITIHVYGKELTNCTRFIEDGQGVYRPDRVPLCYTSRPEGVA